MKIALIIPLYKQTDNWPKLLKGIKSQTVKPDKIYLIFDRSGDWVITKALNDTNDPDLDITYHAHTHKIDEPDYFLAPYNRNKGIELAIEDGCDVFIFIDGDCVPQKKLIESHVNKLKYELPVLSVGRRRESIYRWQDRREHVPELNHLNLFRKDGTLINNASTELLKNSLIVWSCNMAMNLPAIKLLRRLNRKYFNRNEVFSSEFNGSWGGEDAYLGIQAYHCRVFITTIGEKQSGVEHIDHPRPKDKYNMEHLEFLNKQIDILRKQARINPLDISFFIV